jgi:glucose-1-phosphate adenylyltransferase
MNSDTEFGMQTLAVVLAGGRGTRLGALTTNRAKPALPFGGSLRVIDFALGNAFNSGLRRVAVLTQYKAQGLIRHLMRTAVEPGRGTLVDIVPAQQQTGESWYGGTADAVHQNLELVRESGARQVLVLAGDHVYKMDYRRMLDDHHRSGAAASVACVEVPRSKACAFGVVGVDASGHVTSFAEKPAHPARLPGRDDLTLVSMGIYIFDVPALVAALCEDAADPDSCHDFGHNLMPRLIRRARVHAHRFADSCVGLAAGAEPYWRDIGTLDAYWAAHMDLLGDAPPLDLYDPAWPITGVPPPGPAARFEATAGAGSVTDVIVSSGCRVSGATLARSVLCPDVRILPGSRVDESVLLPGVQVGRNVVLRRTIVDAGCTLPDGIRIGVHADEDRARFHVTEQGVTLVSAEMLAPRSFAQRVA